MLRQGRGSIQELLPGKIRKRGCSSSASSSSSSIIQNYRFKRAILVGKRGGSSTPVPAWKLMKSTRVKTPSSTLRAIDSPRSQNGVVGKGKVQNQLPVSARKLAATLWEMNDMPSPRVVEERRKKEGRGRERGGRSMHSGSLPPHLSDPSHSPLSESGDRSGTGSRHRRTPSVSQKLKLLDQTVGAFDSISNASFMEVETRSHAQTPTASSIGGKSRLRDSSNVLTTSNETGSGGKTRLKDVSNALTTSKELLKIISRVWGNEDRPSSSMSLISALHSELERARLQINHIIQEQRSEQNEINYLMKCFAEEKAAWKNKEQKVVEAAIESMAGELEVEKKLRRRLESLNKKLGTELAETKSSLLKAVKELENEKKARAVLEQVCDELVQDIGDDKAEAEELKRESAKLCEEVEKEREMMQLADVLREERVQMKLSEAKYHLEEKNAAVDKLRSQLEVFLGGKRTKEKGRGSFEHMNDDMVSAYLNKARLASLQNEVNLDDREVEDGVECLIDSADSDLHSIDLNIENGNKGHKLIYSSGTPHDPRKMADDEEELKGRRSTTSKAPPRRSTSLQRSITDIVEWSNQNDRQSISGNGLDWEKFSELEKQAQEKGYGEEMHRYQSVKGLREYLLSGSRTDSPRCVKSPRVYASPTRQAGHLRHPGNAAQDRPPIAPGNASKSRLAEGKGEGLNARKSRW